MRTPLVVFVLIALCLAPFWSTSTIEAKKQTRYFSLYFDPADAQGNPSLGSQVFARNGLPLQTVAVSLFAPDLYQLTVSIGGTEIASETYLGLPPESIYTVPNDPSLIGLDITIELKNLNTGFTATLHGTIGG